MFIKASTEVIFVHSMLIIVIFSLLVKVKGTYRKQEIINMDGGALVFLGMMFWLLYRIFRGPFRPQKICPECRSLVIPRLDFRTKDTGYCPCCGAVMWRRERAEGADNPGRQLPTGDPPWCPDCQKRVLTVIDDRHKAKYCSVCGVVLWAEPTRRAEAQSDKRRKKPLALVHRL